MVRRPYTPGQKKKKRRRTVSEYGKELREKQRLKEWYNLRERQFQNYVREVLAKRQKSEDAETTLIRILETRLDSVVFRLGIAYSRKQAKQLVSHGHFLVNGKSVNVPSCRLKKGDVVSLKSSKLKKPVFQGILTRLKKYKTPSWLSLDAEKLEGKLIGEPSFEEAAPPVEMSSIFEFYSR
jgi:small subunit ribosomal protein S4